MTFDPDRHHRRSIRLRGYDYSRAGLYFVTFVIHDRYCLFGNIENGNMELNDAGCMIEHIRKSLPVSYHGIDIDVYQIMPNHFHGIIVIVGAGPCACPYLIPETGQPQGVASTMALPDVVHCFKSMTTKCYSDGVKRSNWQPFAGKLWQRNYYEHIIRNKDDLKRIREYIISNPVHWDEDEENPYNIPH